VAKNHIGDDLLVVRIVLDLGSRHEEVLVANHLLVPLESIADEAVPCAIRKDVLALHAKDLLGGGAHS